MNILAIVAHPDDADIWCGGTLRKYSERGEQIFICVAANGNLGTNRRGQEEIIQMREQEQREAARLYNAQVKLLASNDFEIVDSFHWRREIVNAIRWADPDVILTHTPADTCSDHKTVGELVTRALLYINYENLKTEWKPSLKTPSLFFADTYAGINFSPEAYVDITGQFEHKREAFRKHKSQAEYSLTGSGWEDNIALLSAFRGLQCGCRYAEGFIGFKTYGFMPDYKRLP